MKTLSNYEMRDVDVLLHPATNLAAHRKTGPLVIERGEGVYVYDSNGKQYIEGLAGLWCTALGYGNQELIEAAREQMSKLSFSHLFGGKSHEPAIELAEKLKELSPAPASKVFFTASGSEANDTQIKLTWYYNNARGKPKKKKIIGRMRGYHGVTIAAASLTGLPIFHADFDLPMARVVHADCPHHYRYAEPGETEEEFATRLAQNLDDLIQREDPETVAAFIAEPIQGAGGVIVPPRTYFEKVQEVLDRYDIRLIVDEVICGFGRTGNWFGSQTYNIKPESISFAKAITSAYVPLGGVTVSEPVYQGLVSESEKLGMFAHGFTYSGHPLACAVAVKTLEIYERPSSRRD
jgi:4-aminobutyrate--pyruvate transaminase